MITLRNLLILMIGVFTHIPNRVFNIFLFLLCLSEWKFSTIFLIFKKLRKNSIKVNSKWLLKVPLWHIDIVPPSFDSRHRESDYTTTPSNLPPENRELFLISESDKIKNPFSLFGYKKMTSKTQHYCCNVGTWL